ncbi:hypothetical protein [Ureibacillus sp. GCM10028918]|uniref:hypothetical protein n=1 Tax=Ureibacillus sp. GCM10028918 TaxID=3273429 RepID=UPI003614E8B9
MRISTARFVTEDDIKMIPIRQMTKKKYVTDYKGKLYCPTPHCPAKLSYSSGKKVHYKTWPHSNHSPTCQHNLERDGVRLIAGKHLKLAVNISKRHKQNALMRAYKSIAVDELNTKKFNHITSKPENTRPSKMKSKALESAQMTLFGGALDGEVAHFKGNKLYSRFVHEIGPSDVGKNRIIKGFIKHIELLESAVYFTVGYQNKEMTIVFEDSFIKEPLNKSYINKFWAVTEWMNRMKTVNFTGVGEVQLTKHNRYELFVLMGTDFKVDGEDLYNLARKMRALAFS